MFRVCIVHGGVIILRRLGLWRGRIVLHLFSARGFWSWGRVSGAWGAKKYSTVHKQFVLCILRTRSVQRIFHDGVFLFLVSMDAPTISSAYSIDNEMYDVGESPGWVSGEVRRAYILQLVRRCFCPAELLLLLPSLTPK